MTRFVPIDLHRHRSVVMHMTAEGEVLGRTRLANNPEALIAEVLKDCPAEQVEVAIEATYGWYWAVDALEGAGVNVHLAAPSRLAAFEGPRVKNDQLKVSRGRITKQGNRLVRWAAIEAAQKPRRDTYLHHWREQLAERRNSRSIAKVATARKIVTLVFYGLRDGEIRCLQQPADMPTAA
jgi:transposase